MPEIKAYLTADGRVAIYWPKGTLPDKATIEQLAYAIMEAKKNPSACANMQKGSTDNGTSINIDSNAKKAESQELFQQLDQEEQKEAVRFMRELIRSKA